MSEDMRGLFFIVKGQYRKGAEPSILNRASNDVSYLGGYDPRNEETVEWYMCLDKETFQCVSCGSNLSTVVRGVYTQIKAHKDLKHYLRKVSKTTSDDTYEQKYLGHKPLSADQRIKKAEGRCPRTSPIMTCLYEAIYDEFGDFYSDLVEEQEDLAYSEVKNSTPFKKSQKRLSKHLVKKETPTPAPKKVLKKCEEVVVKKKPLIRKKVSVVKLV